MNSGKKALEELSFDLIQQHMLDPEHTPLDPRLAGQLNRVITAAKLLDNYPNETHMLSLMQAKYNVSRTQLRKDIALARQLFKTEHTFDWDFWQAWQIKDQMELIRECKLRGDLKAWNNAKKVLLMMIGEKPEALEDPRRMERNTFVIQVNAGTGDKLNINLDTIRSLTPSQRKEIIDTLYQNVDDAQVEEIMNS